MTLTYGQLSSKYESKEFTVATATTDYDVKTWESAFTEHKHFAYCVIRTDQTISVKFNDTDNDSITITSSDSPKAFNLAISNVYITNASGSLANIKIEFYYF